MPSRERVDLLVIGGGIVGMAAAWDALQRGLRVAVVDRRTLGAGASRVAAGLLAPVAEAETTPPALLQLGLESRAIYPDWIAAIEQAGGLDAGYAPHGSLLVALDEDQARTLTHHVAAIRELGLPVDPVAPAAAARDNPGLVPDARAVWRLPHDHSVDTRRLCAALATALERGGADLLAGRWPRTIEPETGAVELVDAAGDAHPMSARRVLAAAGAWTARAIPGFEALPVRPVRGQIVRLEGPPVIGCVVRGADIYLAPRADGELAVGATSTDGSFDETPSDDDTRGLLAAARRVVPGVDDLRIVESRAGLRPALPDGLPAIGHWAGRVWLATGHHRNGILLAPATAARLGAALFESAPDAPLAPFAPHRFSRSTRAPIIGAP